MPAHVQLARTSPAPVVVSEALRRSHGLIAIDPGAEGVALFWDRFVEAPRRPNARRWLGPDGAGIREAVERAMYQRWLVACEDQFLGRGKAAGSLIRLVRSGGMVVGALQSAASVSGVVWVPPRVWQSPLAAGSDAKARSRANAVDRLGAEWLDDQGTRAQQQAVADAYGIACYLGALVS